jgi:hypothetical protein
MRPERAHIECSTSGGDGVTTEVPVPLNAAAEHLRAQFEALGAAQPKEAGKAIYEFYCDYWREKKAPPTMLEVAGGTGLCPRRTQDHVNKLVADGRLLRVEERYGTANSYYVPVVVKPRTT